MTPPGSFGADIVVGDTTIWYTNTIWWTTLWLFRNYKKLMRKVPGRLVGQTQDDEGNRGFVLTLQAVNNIFVVIKPLLISVQTKH